MVELNTLRRIEAADRAACSHFHTNLLGALPHVVMASPKVERA